MTLDLYGKEDILNVLRALQVSSEVPTALAIDLLQDRELVVGEKEREALAGQGRADQSRPTGRAAQEQMLSYQKGFRAALASVALAFGLVPVSTSSPAASLRTSERYELDLRSFVESMVRSEA